LPKIRAANDNGESLWVEAGEHGSWTWHALDFEADPWAREVCNELQDEGRELGFREIGAIFGRSKSWAEVEFKRGMRKLRVRPEFDSVEDWL
ncbi:MAG: hypothetical protein MO852_17290, partial [Candidatus Devosia euplotis]|nr:hypothetical protein [Candidatus Devosia euplotis]